MNGTISLHDEHPLIIGYLVLWLYTLRYYESKNEDVAYHDSLFPTIQSIMTLGRDAKSGACSPMLDHNSLEELDSLHAQMYWLADRYEINGLKDEVVSKLKDQLTQVPDTLVLNLKHLLALSMSSAAGSTIRDGSIAPPVRSRCTLTAKAERQVFNAPEALVEPNGSGISPSSSNTTIQSDALEVLATFFTSGRSGRKDMAGSLTINPEDDAELWSLLVSTTSEYISKHVDDATFGAIMQSNPSFQWDVLQQVAKGRSEIRDDVNKLLGEIEKWTCEVEKREDQAKELQGEVERWRGEVGRRQDQFRNLQGEVKKLRDEAESNQRRVHHGTPTSTLKAIPINTPVKRARRTHSMWDDLDSDGLPT